MEQGDKVIITVKTRIHAGIDKVWKTWTDPQHIMKWNNASEDWHTTRAENDLKTGGKFLSRMEAKDGSMGFDFGGVYDEVSPLKKICYTLGDGRRVEVNFSADGPDTFVEEQFEAENVHSVDMQRDGWQAILDNFKKHTEAI